MLCDMPKGYNIGYDIISDRCITTGACPAVAPFGGYYLRYETIIWNYDVEKRERTIMRDMIFHPSEKEAKKVHGTLR